MGGKNNWAFKEESLTCRESEGDDFAFKVEEFQESRLLLPYNISNRREGQKLHLGRDYPFEHTQK